MAEDMSVLESIRGRLEKTFVLSTPKDFGVSIEADATEISDSILASDDDDLLIEGFDTDRLSLPYVSLLEKAASRIPKGEVKTFDIVRRNLLSLAKNGSIEVDGQTLRLPLIPNEMPGRSNFRDFLILRAFAMRLYVESPELLIEGLKNRVVGVHGSRSGSLWGVLDHGLRPQDKLLALDAIVSSGEHVFGGEGINKNHVSFNQWYARGADMYAYSSGKMTEESLETTIRHSKEEQAELGPDSLISYKKAIKHAQTTLDFLRKPSKTPEEKIQEQLIRENFPVLYTYKLGARPNKGHIYDDPNIVIPISGIHAEFAVRDGADISDIPIILVPEERVEQVRNLVEIRYKGESAPKVMPIEPYQRAIKG